MELQTVGNGCVALHIHSRVTGTLIVARPSEGLAVEVADYALPFLGGK